MTDSSQKTGAKPREGRCHHWLTSKKKFCQQQIVSQKGFSEVVNYCRFHVPSSASITCDLCHSSILPSNWHKHRNESCVVLSHQTKMKQQIFYNEHAHFEGDYQSLNTECQSECKSSTSLTLESVLHAFRKVIENRRRMESFMESFSVYPNVDVHLNESLKPRLDQRSNESIAEIYTELHSDKMDLKHRTQIESMVSHILSEPEDCSLMMELGSGKAQLGCLAYAHCLRCSSHCTHRLITVDNSSFRHRESNKLLNLLAHSESHDRCLPDVSADRFRKGLTQVQCGIEDLNGSVLLNQSDSTLIDKLIVLSKHLCGAATDFGLRMVESMVSDSDQSHCADTTVAIALCCRGKCSFRTFCNHRWLKSTLKSVLGFELADHYGPDLFGYLKRIATWSVDSVERDTIQSNIAQLCRILIDFARIDFCLNRLMVHSEMSELKMIRYCPESITLENHLLLIRMRPLSHPPCWYQFSSL